MTRQALHDKIELGGEAKSTVKRIFNWKLIAAILAPTVVLLTSCLLCRCSPTASDIERLDFEPKERVIATEHFTLEIGSAHWEKRRARQRTINPLEQTIIEDNVLLLEMTVDNHLAQQLDLVCYVEDAAGYTYSPDFEADRSAFDEGEIFISSFQPLERVQAQMEFHLLPDDDQELWFHCGLCDDAFVCVEGKLHDVAIQIK